MALLPANYDYSDKDFESLRARLFSLVRSVFPDWTDESVNNFANLLTEAHSFMGDVLTFYQDQQAREGRMAFVELRKNMIALCKLIGYQLAGATAATADVVLTISNPEGLVGTVTPDTTLVVVKTEEITDPIKGELQGAISFDVGSGEIEKTFTWEHSITQTPYTVASNQRPDQEILLPFGPYLEGSGSVTTPTQPVWTVVNSFFDSGPTDRHVRIQVDQNNLARFIFGDGQNGEIPVGNMTFNWKTGGGISGDVEQNSLKRIEGTFSDSNGNRAYITATNPAAAEGGYPREEVNAARINGPESITVVNRTIARTDYEINAKRVPEVGRALMLTSDNDTGIDENSGKLYIIPVTGGTPSQSVLDDVYTMCTETYPNPTTFDLDVNPAAFLTINIRAVVWFKENVVRSTVKASIDADLEDFFEPMNADGTPNENVDFGYNYKDAEGNPAGEIAWSDIFNVVRDNAGLRKVGAGATEFTLNGLRADVALANHQFPAYGTLTLIDGETGNEV
jgi:hypothetical protein